MAAYAVSKESCAPGQPDTHSAQRSSRSVRKAAQYAANRYSGAAAGSSPSRAATTPKRRMGSTSQRTATLDTSAYRLAESPRSTSTGKVAAAAQPDTQTVSQKPSSTFRSRFALRRDCVPRMALQPRRASSAPASVPSTAENDSSKPTSQTA